MMNFKKWCKRLLCYALMLSMVLTPSLPGTALALDNGGAAAGESVTFSQVDNDKVSASLLEEVDLSEEYELEEEWSPDDVVRVSIVLDDAATIEAGYAIDDIAENSRAISYRQKLKNKQNAMKKTIEKALGESLTVKWNLTLAANLISAEVPYGSLDTIRRIDGVKEVVIEQQYQPMATAEAVADPKMTISDEMTGMKNSWLKGYTGAGSRVAIIDTGIDVDHQSFDGAALDYSLEQNAAAKSLDKDTYLAGLDLLSADEIDKVINNLNIVGITPAVKGSNVYHNTKLAFAYNYVDHGYDYVDHNRDQQSDHGSHVAGIAAANRYIAKGGSWVDALDEVKVAGAAPDAQLIVLKVFGMQGGAYDSDYMAAIEDAIVLGADSINLSLGTSFNGYTTAGIYQEIMAGLTEAGAVVCMAAGNEGDFSSNAITKEQTGGTGLLYTDDVEWNHMGSPASYTNSMAVASVDNQGSVSDAFLSFDSGSLIVGYSETVYNDMQYMTSMDKAASGGTEYDFVMLTTLGKDEDFSGIDVTDKIVFISRGENAFYEKANNAVKYGAAATIIYNNVDGTIGMDMTSYTGKKPAVAITKQDAAKIRAIATAQKTTSGVDYYTGKMRVHSTLSVNRGDKDSYVMSSFSSWGTTGDLALKPEITAPGGSIYSVNGSSADTDKYKVNSGTSMATPQVAGITAAIAQYIRDNKLCEKFGHSSRQIAQSLLMASAIPMKDANGSYYPLLQQGAGLANGERAVNAGAYIMMSANATPSYADGKVKAELGDDPNRTGKYEFEFTVYNTENTAKEYALSAELFSQDIVEYPSAAGAKTKAEYQLKSTKSLASAAKFSQNGTAVTSVTVPAGQSVKLKAELSLEESAKAWLGAHYTNGTYIYGLVFLKPAAATDGALENSELSIPMLAFWGNWTEPAMYDATSWQDGKVVSTYSTPTTTDTSRTSYGEDYDALGEAIGSIIGANHVVMSNSDGVSYKLGGNPLVQDKEYMPERNAISTSATAEYWHYMPLRDSVSITATIDDVTNGKTLWRKSERAEVRGEYYYKSGAYWTMTGMSYALNQDLSKVESGTKVAFTFTRLPEYYDEGKIGENSTPGKGATLKVEAVVDSALPTVESITYSSGAKQLTVKAKDENYVAAVALYSRDGKEILGYCGSDGDLKQGESGTYVLQLDKAVANECLLQVYDYAMNTVTYRLNIAGDTIGYSGAMLAFDPAAKSWVQVDDVASDYATVTDSILGYTAAVAVENKIYAIAYGTELYALDVKNPQNSSKIGDTTINITDLAYNAKDGNLYGVSDESQLIKIDKTNAKATVVGNMPIKSNTLACDSNGVFYANLLGSGKVYAFELSALGSGDVAYDVNGDGVFDMNDVQAVLDFASGKESKTVSSDLNSDGRTDTYDAYLLLQKLPGSIHLVADCGVPSAYLQSMEIDPNNDTLYWASYSTETVGDDEVGFAYLYKIDTTSGKVVSCGDLNKQLACLTILEKDAGSSYAPLYDVANIAEAESAVSALSQKTYMNSYAAAAALAANYGVKTNSGAGEEKTVEIEVTADSKLYNGLYKVTFGADLKFATALSKLGAISTNAADGSVTVALAGMDEVKAGDTVVTLRFKAAACANDLTLSRLEENATRPNTTETLASGAHNWGDWTVTKAATCKEAGSKERKCLDCTKKDTKTIPIDSSAHKWGSAVSGGSLEKLGTEYKECELCGKKQTEIKLGANMQATEQASYIGRIWAKQHRLESGLVTGAGVEKVAAITTDDTSDNTLRYLVTLCGNTALNAKFHLHLEPQGYMGSGHGMALKKDKVDSVTWDADDTEYDVELVNGASVVKFYGYENSSDCTPFEIYFQIGDEGELLGSLQKIKVDTSDSTPRLAALEIWESGEIVKTYLQSNDDKSKNDFYIWLSDDTDKAARLLLKPEYAGSLTLGKNVTALGDGAFAVDLSGGVAQATVTVSSGMTSRIYNLHFGSSVNKAPELRGEAEGTARVKVGTAYTLDLAQVFADVNGDELSYSYSLDGAAAVATDKNFTFTPDKAGEYVFVFTASDGKAESPTYTLTLTAADSVAVVGDINGDSKVTMADVVMLERYLAEWMGVSVGDSADTNGDSKVTMADVVMLERYLAEWAGVVLGGNK